MTLLHRPVVVHEENRLSGSVRTTASTLSGNSTPREFRWRLLAQPEGADSKRVLRATDRGITCWAVFEETDSPAKTIVVSIDQSSHERAGVRKKSKEERFGGNR
jgi:hypothetical protein